MTDASKLGRRDFLGSSLAITAGASIAYGLAHLTPPRTTQTRVGFGHGAELRFEEDGNAFPDCPITAEFVLPKAPTGLRALAWLHIQTPHEHLTEKLGETRFYGGVARVETVMRYPYEREVAGEYRYYVEVVCANGERLVTEMPVGFFVRKFQYFS